MTDEIIEEIEKLNYGELPDLRRHHLEQETDSLEAISEAGGDGFLVGVLGQVLGDSDSPKEYADRVEDYRGWADEEIFDTTLDELYSDFFDEELEYER